MLRSIPLTGTDWARCRRSRRQQFARSQPNNPGGRTGRRVATGLSNRDIDSPPEIPDGPSMRRATSMTGCWAHGQDCGPSMRSHAPCTPCTMLVATRAGRRESGPPPNQRYSNKGSTCRRTGHATPIVMEVTRARGFQHPTASPTRLGGRPRTIHQAARRAAIDQFWLSLAWLARRRPGAAPDSSNIRSRRVRTKTARIRRPAAAGIEAILIQRS